ncbi:hypothetical protein Q2T76_04380 [Lactobacillus sp. YT155]|uniref:hypothetical protein n=1 Tax=Lactobacillus sp. YT155 TaxID=3060955 RepID=UPI002660545F|nr:hypothetical protein [Lactobacillus sp. YT155]MDO1605292.1 hypothetical protein [Lactobacillus sp. YT155]
MSKLFESPIFYVVLGVAIVLYFIYAIVWTQRKKKRDKEFEKNNSNIGKVHTQPGMKVTSDTEQLKDFIKGVNIGYYFEPGKHTVNVEYEYQRTLPVKKTIRVKKTPISFEIEAGKEYDLSYNQDENRYNFEEI